MSQSILKKPAVDFSAMEIKIQLRLQREKTKLLIAHILFFILSAGVILFAI